ncbi:hypothetical protein NQ318_018757 [Aromia moschata]|uniref:Helicase SKI2W n=1 Tax=Aromia moschata TaxID=1265417 RepID=A0AAV8ZG10_9CUCU|nr:hypothetical protein NQ318_018757 [Aromia moschata]
MDTFQKLSILQLEQHNHVFVAAHTSAGKTVVAEYAIALSQRHMTRTIYTSPIKALSNQKYRDFKTTFKDVGLITGDFQINQKASCLIMTTEILRSMLYCGSDITRDLEFTTSTTGKGGHVWEQVLIMLPAHVCVVLLSATVPNTIEFADWLGRTHQRKVYVVTTYKRPVPLQHYLYTGKGGGSRDNRFKILDGDKWLMNGYTKAKESLKPDQQKNVYQKMTQAQEKNLWSGLVDHLKRNDLLPVVAFTFSRQKCDVNASNLTNLDLTTQKEKAHINMFFNRCIRCLKEPDQNIPQVLTMRDILNRGIGVHHSGILPIIKEIVEMLFQRGCIKLLFATETFAMGVNMPARTVVFDSVRKHDSKELRDLAPAEYIQMAGRAVSARQITKKNMSELKRQLEEVDKQMEELFRQQISSYMQPLVKFFECTNATYKFEMILWYVIVVWYSILIAQAPKNADSRSDTGDHSQAPRQQAGSPPAAGPVQAVALQGARPDRSLCREARRNEEDLWYYMLGLARDKLFLPLSSPGHEILTVSPADVFEVSGKTLKLNMDVIAGDVEKRQMERFRHDPPGQTCVQAVQELHKLTLLANDDRAGNKLEYLHFVVDLRVSEPGLYEKLKTMYESKDKIIDHLPGTQIPNFEQQFATVFTRKFLEEKKKNLEFRLSNASLLLYPDYENRIALLKTLNYVDNQNRGVRFTKREPHVFILKSLPLLLRFIYFPPANPESASRNLGHTSSFANISVQLKGRVACEMGMNELLITELVLRNVLIRLRAPEVAALLSALVYRMKSRNEGFDDSNLPADLKKAIAEMIQVHLELGDLELRMGIQTDEFQEDLNFALVHVVYEWASNKPFADIMQLTDIQEGIIVRCIQQLNETICDVRDAARIIGDPKLQSKMEEASAAIKRDIVFAASLYTRENL